MLSILLRTPHLGLRRGGFNRSLLDRLSLLELLLLLDVLLDLLLELEVDLLDLDSIFLNLLLVDGFGRLSVLPGLL